jgi:hypothetical protein
MKRRHTIYMTETGNFKTTMKWLKALKEKNWAKTLDKYGKMGVDALREATPKDTGVTANSWYYEITTGPKFTAINWYNTNVIKDYFNVALMIQRGHGTGSGAWIEGIDYINPALQEVFQKMADGIWEEVKNT